MCVGGGIYTHSPRILEYEIHQMSLHNIED